MISNDTLIISMTSYPARISYVGLVWFSILEQIQNTDDIHCVLVLSVEEFPHYEADLPSDLLNLIRAHYIELLWTPNDTRSHKKLMPTLAKYPNNSILIIDDDQLRPNGWLKSFISDHHKYPNDILAGRIMQKEKNEKFIDAGLSNDSRGKIIVYGRPQNGRGGTLYPPHTFIDQCFFDESLYMKYSASSDESWQYYWMRKHNKWPRLLSAYPKDEHLVIREVQNDKALWFTNCGKYDAILKTLINQFG